MVRSWFEAGRRPASNLSATSFEPARVMEFGFYTPASSTGSDYGIGIVGKCLGLTTSKGPTKDGYKIFWKYVNQSVSSVGCMDCKH